MRKQVVYTLAVLLSTLQKNADPHNDKLLVYEMTDTKKCT